MEASLIKDEWELLQDYLERDSEAAFRALVDRYLDLVHTVALRQVNDPQLAEEICEVPFPVRFSYSYSYSYSLI